MDRNELRGTDGIVYGVIEDGVLTLPSRQSRKHRTVEYERWDIRSLIEPQVIALAHSSDRSAHLQEQPRHNADR